jgi:hypothetical protein
MTKRCGRCEEVKPVSEFHRYHRGGFQAWCKACRKIYDAAYTRATRERRREIRREKRPEFLAWYHALKTGRPCAECGQVYHWSAMQWDHRPGEEKGGNVGDLARRMCKRRVLIEIAKCDLVCANCHALRTFRRAHGA